MPEEIVHVEQTSILTRYRTQTRPSRGDLDDIDPEDIIYGEYSNDISGGEYVDLIYIDNDILRTISEPLTRPNPKFDELTTLLRDDDKFYVIEIKEVQYGFAFKRNDIVTIKVTSVMEGKTNRPASCTWTITFEDNTSRGIEISYQSYFTYGNTTRPSNMTNSYILDKNLPSK